MAKIPLKYCVELYNRVTRYVDSAKIYNTKLTQKRLEYGEVYYNVYHYDTIICRIYPVSNVCCLFGAYSPSDRDIINSFLKIFNVTYKCYIHKGKMYCEEIYQRI